MFHNSSYRVLMDPMALCLLLSRLESSNSQTSRLENRARVGSTVILKNVSTNEKTQLHIGEVAMPNSVMEVVPYTSVLGCELLGLRLGEVARIKTAIGVVKWKVISINNESLI